MSAMKNSEIEKHIADAVQNETPDILEKLLGEIEAQDTADSRIAELKAADPVQFSVSTQTAASAYKAAPKKRIWLSAIAGIAAAFMIFAGVRGVMARQLETFAVVDLDVNPGIEISINQKERVISATPVNNEAKDILADMKLDGSDINVACNAIIGSMLTHGYLTSDSNSVLVSVRANDTEKGKALEQDLSSHLNSYLENSEIAAAILGQFVENDDELAAFAEANGISLGKAWLIRKLLASGNPKYSEESLLKLSTQELILLGQKKTVKKEDSYGKASTSKYIGAKKAKSIALEQAGLTADQAGHIKAELDCDDGVIVYEVEFTVSGYEYEYDINATTGEVVSSDIEHDGEHIAPGNDPAPYDDDDDDDDDDRYERDDDDHDDDDRYERDDDHDDGDNDDDDDDDDRYERDDDDDEDERRVTRKKSSTKKSSSKSSKRNRDHDDDDDDDDDD